MVLCRLHDDDLEVRSAAVSMLEKLPPQLIKL